MACPTCTCGHLVVDDRRCACTGRCRECANVDCCAETWATYVSSLPSNFTRHDYAGWEHCDACYATFERVNRRSPL